MNYPRPGNDRFDFPRKASFEKTEISCTFQIDDYSSDVARIDNQLNLFDF